MAKKYKSWKPKNIFDKISSFIYYQIEGIKNIIKWFPVIYKDKQFDHSYLLTILEFKFSLMEDYFRNHGLASTSKKDAKRIQLCKNLCKRINEGYHDNVYMLHDKKWGSIKMLIDEKGHLQFIRENSKTPEDFQKESSEFRKLMKKEQYLQKQDQEVLSQTMKKYMTGWWD